MSGIDVRVQPFLGMIEQRLFTSWPRSLPSQAECAGRPYSHSTDLWSLGVVLYELLNLELPFRGPSLQEPTRDARGVRVAWGCGGRNRSRGSHCGWDW